MKVSIVFILFFGYSTIAAGSDHEPELGFVVSADDFPYIIFDKPDWSWSFLRSILYNFKDMNMKTLLSKYHDLLHSNFEMGRILRDLIIQHCVAFHLKAKFTENEVNLIREAIKTGLLISKARIESGISNELETMLTIFQKIETLLNARMHESSVARMLDNAKYAVRSYVNEYVTISLSNGQIANFLTELFTLMDGGRQQNDSYYISEIVTREQVHQPQIEERDIFVAEKDATNLLTLFLSCHSIVEDYNTKPARNRQQISFQNLLIRNHCARKHAIDQLSPEFKRILDNALEQKTKRAESLLQQSIDEIFKYSVDCTGADCTGVLHRADRTNIKNYASLTLANLKTDPIFSVPEVRLSDDYKSAIRDKSQIIDEVDTIISSWIVEKILISTARHEMYLPVSKIFKYIDDASDESKEAVKAVLAVKLPRAEVIYFGKSW